MSSLLLLLTTTCETLDHLNHMATLLHSQLHGFLIQGQLFKLLSIQQLDSSHFAMRAHLSTQACELYDTVKALKRKQIRVHRKQIKVTYPIGKTSCCQSAGHYESKHTHSACCEGNIEIWFLMPAGEIYFEIKEFIQSQVTTGWSHFVVFLKSLCRKCVTVVSVFDVWLRRRLTCCSVVWAYHGVLCRILPTTG